MSTAHFGDKSAARVHLRWLSFVNRIDGLGGYSRGSTALAWLYRTMCRASSKNVAQVAGPLQLLQSWIFWRFPMLRWLRYQPTSNEKEPLVVAYRTHLDLLSVRADIVEAVVHPSIWHVDHKALWTSIVPLIYFSTIKWHQVDRVIPQFEGVQNTPHRPLNIDFLHAKDSLGIDRWWPSKY
ncbi:hypothetical protein PIB30_004083 [Stylosanthes scabra]|uniref:Aminotransferase-like plant mobile domain-containing protein n=1 Tax=Stylosanthes scabra TaxID=79078 RepID=A0ABU6Z291_9FABA|nr:hypothetical protein [Stylosanthes scabra]